MLNDNLATLVERLEASGVLADRRLVRLREAIDDQTSPATLIEKLLQLDWITSWQADALQTGQQRLSFAEYALREPVLFEPVSGESVAGESVAGEPVAGESVAGELVAGEAGRRAFYARHITQHIDCRLDILPPTFVSNPQQVARLQAAIDRTRCVVHPFFLKTIGLIRDETTHEWAIVSERTLGEWQAFSTACVTNAPPTQRDNTAEGDSDFGASSKPSTRRERPSREQRLQVAAIMRNLAVAWAHAHESEVFDPGLQPSQIQFDAAGAVRVVHFGLSEIHDATPTWQLSPSHLSPTDKQQRIQYDLQRLGQLGLYLLTGTPQPSRDQPHSTRLELVFRWLLTASAESRIQTMTSAAKAVERWDRSNRRRATPGQPTEPSRPADHVMAELHQGTSSAARLTANVRVPAPGDSTEASFRLGPAVDPSFHVNAGQEQTTRTSSQGSATATGAWVVLGVIGVLAIGVGLIAILNLVFH